MRLRRYHGLGNDYLVLETAEAVDERLVVALCDRHRGVGSDGLLQPLPLRRDAETGRPVSHYAVRIWNPDGSRAEKSGNGLRILARWLRDHRAAPPTFTVEVRLDESPGERVQCTVAPPAGTGDVTVSMGPARFQPGQVPCTRPLRASAVEVLGARLELTAVGTGNPHCVCFVDALLPAGPGADDVERGAALDAALDTLPWRAWGAALEVHPLFPRRTNVQFACLLPPQAGDPPADRGAWHAEGRGRAGEGPRLRDAQEHLDVAQGHVARMQLHGADSKRCLVPGTAPGWRRNP